MEKKEDREYKKISRLDSQPSVSLPSLRVCSSIRLVVVGFSFGMQFCYPLSHFFCVRSLSPPRASFVFAESLLFLASLSGHKFTLFRPINEGLFLFETKSFAFHEFHFGAEYFSSLLSARASNIHFRRPHKRATNANYSITNRYIRLSRLKLVRSHNDRTLVVS